MISLALFQDKSQGLISEIFSDAINSNINISFNGITEIHLKFTKRRLEIYLLQWDKRSKKPRLVTR